MLTERLALIQTQLKERQIDCMALIPGYNLRYLTELEFHLMERAVILFIPAEGAPVFALPTLERAKAASLPITGLQCFTYDDGQEPTAAVNAACNALPEIHTLAVENLRMRVHELNLIRRPLPNAQLSDAQPIMDTMRLRKTEDEIARMRKAIEVTEKALQNTIDRVSTGMTEMEVANRLSIAMLEAGGGVLPFEPIVLTGARCALPHGMPSEAKIKAGDLVLFDFGTSVDGYISDLTRVFSASAKPTPRQMQVYETVKAANAAGRAAAKPGVACQEVDRAARKVIDEAGFGEYFFHRVGHGIGMEGHEGPYMVEGNTQILEPGMCFTVEPGIYIQGEIGVRIEDDLVITEEGAESLTRFSREFKIIGR